MVGYVGVVEVIGPATRDFDALVNCAREMHEQFSWHMPVRLISKCAADQVAPRLADFHNKRIGEGSYQSIEEEKAIRIIDAITASAP